MIRRFCTLTGPGLPGHLIALLSGCALPLSFAPFDIWPLGLLSVFLLVACLQQVDVRNGSLRNYLFGIGMYGAGVSWIYVSIHEHGGASVGLAAGLVILVVLSYSLIAAAQGYLYVRFFRKGILGTVLGFACLWVAQEWFRTWFLTGFPWLFLGYGFMNTPLVYFAPVTGILGMSLVAALTASTLFALIFYPNCIDAVPDTDTDTDTDKEKQSSLPKRQSVLSVRQGSLPARQSSLSVRESIGSIVLVACLWLVAGLLSFKQWVEPVPDSALEISLIQGNIDQKVKWRREMVQPILDLYWQMSRTEWDRDLIIWPEAAVTLFRHDATTFLERIDKKGKTSDTAVITGIPVMDLENRQYFNSAIALGQGSGTYHKRRLVPFGEYVPLEEWLRGLIELFDLPMSATSIGPASQDPIKVGPWSVSTLICYEILYPDLVRATIPIPDILLTISNDTWFGKSIGPIQHMQMARMRAVENGRYLIRATNNGITAIVDEQGQMIKSLPQFERGVLRGTVYVMTGTTPFSRWGSLPVLLICALGLLLAFFRKGEVRV